MEYSVLTTYHGVLIVLMRVRNSPYARASGYSLSDQATLGNLQLINLFFLFVLTVHHMVRSFIYSILLILLFGCQHSYT
ncbi:hypothetical protein BDV28DRAFT_132714 [Aspergillus coremiiformis]|uniref:Uncharacterized protein n=1 Tax=Aspergillus coremiiformis TaxID=138285 RepID=A0A5N6Z7U9_9EURO|nr:hypothetical protein BDV28DRAFT_132714 [Aspergillus coremiiformis]